MNTRPAMASDEHVVLDTDTTPGLGASTIHATAASGGPANLVCTIIGTITGLVVFACAFYLVLASTVFVILGAGDHKVGVLRNAYPVGQAPAGALVYTSTAPVGTGLNAALSQTFTGVHGGSVVQIVAGPTGTVTTVDGHIAVNGTGTTLTGNLSHELTREYLATCIAGDCTPGDPVIIGQSHIVGAAKGYLGIFGLEDIEANAK